LKNLFEINSVVSINVAEPEPHHFHRWSRAIFMLEREPNQNRNFFLNFALYQGVIGAGAA
jgi:hypothetical protein